MKRLDCLQAVYDRLAACAVITNMGAVAAELHTLGHRPNFFYLEHAMGLASSMGLGVALAQPERRVVVLDGDGSVLMNLGTFTTLARYAPGNLVHVIFDNERLLSSIDGFPTATATGADLAGIARAAGIANACTVRTVEEFRRQVEAAIGGTTLACVVAKIDTSMPASFHLDLHLLENRFAFARALRTTPG